MQSPVFAGAEFTLPGFELPPRDWDLIFTCFEPLFSVTGGIGTYHRLLLEELADSGLNILVLTRSVNMVEDALQHVTMLNIDDLKLDKPFTFVGLKHDFFSLRCHLALRSLFRNGHRFGFIEFSDYGRDGFYPLRARASGIYEFGVAAVRLHSPDVMLLEDNGRTFSSLTQYERDCIDREMSVYQDADVILYGGEAMRDRVLSLTEMFGLDVAGKMQKCPHPYPERLFNDGTTKGHLFSDLGQRTLIRNILSTNKHAERESLQGARFIGLFGRIEDRKGQYQMFWQCLNDKRFVQLLKEDNIHFVVAGHSVLDHIRNFQLKELYKLIHERRLESHIHFMGQVPQSVLFEYSHAMSGFIFPSFFENYPNALLEVLPACKPIAISVFGCMPEITHGFTNIHHINPKQLNMSALLAFIKGIPQHRSLPDQSELHYRRSIFKARNSTLRSYYTRKFSMPEVSRPKHLPSIGVVIPVYQDAAYLEKAILSAKQALDPGEPIVVVDDGSSKKNASAIAKIVQKTGVRLIALPENSGPSIARLKGAQALSTDLIQLCDADDLLDPAGLQAARLMFARDPDLTMATGVMNCFQNERHMWVPRNGHIWTGLQEHFAHSGNLYRRRALIDALNVENTRLPVNEDWLMNLLVLAHGGKCRMIPEITYHYRRTAGTRSLINSTIAGKARQVINDTVGRELSFNNPELNARVRNIFISYHDSDLGISCPVSEFGNGDSPLRYRCLDAVFNRLIKINSINRFLRWIKLKIEYK